MDIVIPKVNTFLKLGIFLMIVKISLSISTVFYYSETIDNILSYASLFLLVSVILIQNYSSKTFIVYLLIGIISLYSVTKTGNNGLLITVVTCLAIRKCNINDIIKFIYNWELLFFIIIVCASIICHFLFSFPITQNIQGVIRYTFGFEHPNEYSVYLFNLIIMWVWIEFSRIKLHHLFAIFIIGLTSFYFSNTRTNFIEICLIIILLFIYCIGRKKEHKIINFMARYIVPFFSILMLSFNLLGDGLRDALDPTMKEM